MILDKDISDCLYYAVENGNDKLLLDSLVESRLSREHLDSIYLKLGEYLPASLNGFQEEYLLENVLHIISELVQTVGINSVAIALQFACSMLNLITDELSNITILKRAVHIFNLLIQNQDILYPLVEDEIHEGSLQILGRKVSTIGDYEGQALLFEVLYRITSLANREYWVNIWFSDAESRELFLNLDPQKFESDCRKALNHLNRIEGIDRRVFSFVAISVSFGSLQLKELKECEFWIDFNYDSQSISFYCSELAFEVPGANEDEQDEASAMWETILISKEYIKAYLVKDWKKEKKTEILLSLNIPCHSIINENYGTNPALDSYEVRILLWEVLNMRRHLEMIYGIDKYAGEELEMSELKVSASSEVIGIIGEERDDYMDDDLFLKKVSTLSSPLPLEVCETEEDFIPASDHNQKYSGTRRASTPVEMIPFTTEDFPMDHRGQFYRKISECSEVIEFETLQDGECVKKKTKRSMSIDTAFYDKNSSFEYSGGKDEEASSSSLENNNHEKNQKAHLKKVRLYNLDTAPVYDVPRGNNSSDPSQENTSFKKDQLISNEQDDIFESRVEESELKEKQVVKTSPPREKSKFAKTTDEDKKLSVFHSFDSEEEFQDLPIRSTGKRKERKNSATTSATSKRNSCKRKYEDVLSDDSSRIKNREQVKTTSAGNKKEFRKRKYEDVLSDDSQSEKDKRVKRPRKAAVKGRRKTRRMFEAKPIPYDEIEILSDDSSQLLTEKVVKKKKLNKNKSESDTFSSEVSWMKPQKPMLFETPKKNYLRRKKVIRKKKELPVEIFPESKSTSKKPLNKKENNCSNLSNYKPRSLNISDFENYSLTIEKSTKSTYTVMKDLEYGFQSLSTSNLGRNSIERNSRTHSKGDSDDSDIDSEPKSEQELKRTAELKVTNNEENCEKRGMSKVLSATNVKQADGASKSSNSVERMSSELQILRRVSSDNYENEDLICSKAHSEIDVNSLPQSSHGELDQKENEDEGKKILPKHAVESASGEYEDEPQNISSDKALEKADNICKDEYEQIGPNHDLKARTSEENESTKFQQCTEDSDGALVGDELSSESCEEISKEKEGKEFILKRYFDSCTAYSDAVNSSRTTLLENESNSHENSSHLSNRASSIGLKSSQKSCSKENDKSSLEHQEYHHDNDDYVEKTCNKIKNKIIRASILSSKGKKRKKFSSEHMEENKKYPETDYPSKKAHSLSSRLATNSLIDSTSYKNLRSQKPLRKANDEKLIALSEELDKYERPMRKQKKIRKLKDNHDNSFHSMHSKLTSSSFDLEKDKKWFQSLTVVLSENAEGLSKRLLGTVQKCFLDFSLTMKALRENLIKTVEVFEMPSSKTISSYKLKYLLKNCKTVRLEMENSLRRMQVSGNEYFQAEERLYRKLRKKNMKASKKFISSMKYVERNTTKQLENRILSKTRSYLKKCLKHIESV